MGFAEDENDLVRLKELAEYIKAEIEQEHTPSLFKPDHMAQWAIAAREKSEDQDDKALNVDLRQLREEKRIIVGIHDVYGRMFDSLGFDRAVGDPSRRREAAKIIRHLVMARIANPTSKRASVVELEKDFGITLNLTSVYRTMDYLDEKQIKFIEDKAMEAATGLFKEKIDVIFYDCTTLYFESIQEDELRDKGWSKDKKFNQSQVLLALMVTKQGIPVGYRLYNGSTFEGDTLEDALRHLKQYHEVGEVVFVADSALFSDDNLNLLERQEGMQYYY
ncbi:MAG: IS1634 family transposase, partial [Pseudothermotoga sp.]